MGDDVETLIFMDHGVKDKGAARRGWHWQNGARELDLNSTDNYKNDNKQKDQEGTTHGGGDMRG